MHQIKLRIHLRVVKSFKNTIIFPISRVTEIFKLILPEFDESKIPYFEMS